MNDFIKTIVATTSCDPVDAKTFYQLFVVDAKGQKVFQQLLNQYWFNLTVPTGSQIDSHIVAYKEGQKSVVSYLISRMVEAQQPNDLDKEQTINE